MTIDLKNPDRVLLGARANGYPSIGVTVAAGIADHEQRIGRRIHLPMTFARPGYLPLPGSKTRTWLQRDDTAILQCWKPVERWHWAHGNDYDVNMYLIRSALAVRDLAQPVLMVIHHEPENDVGVSGSASDYRTMWAHIRRVFADNGANNVTWGMAFMNYPRWEPDIADLWPTQADPEWVFFNAYGSPYRSDYATNINTFYEGLVEERWFASGSKLWGVREWSVKHLATQEACTYFDDATRVNDEGLFPGLRAHIVFDSPGKENLSEMRIAFTPDREPDPVKAEAYQRFAHRQAFGPVVAP